jgi:lipopolysaccharide export system permease protein
MRLTRMRTLDRYVAANISQNVLLALVVLVAVFSVINATEELQHVGAGRYGVGQALWFVFLTLPNEFYALLPAAAVLGNVIGLGGLAQRNEIIAMAGAGISRGRIVWSALRPIIALAVLAVAFGEMIAAPLSYRARTERSIALSDGRTLAVAGGIWTRAGSGFVNLRTVLPDGSARDVYVYDFDAQHRMRHFVHADTATYADHRWVLGAVADQTIADTGISTSSAAARTLDDLQLTPRQLGLVRVPPEELSLSDLSHGIATARRQGESVDHLALARWQRGAMPVVIVVMSFLAVALILSLPRAPTLGRRVFVGGLLGIGFQMVNQTFASFGLVYGVAPWLSAVLPTLAAFAFAVWCVMRSAL